MFSKAKRFQPVTTTKTKSIQKPESDTPATVVRTVKQTVAASAVKPVAAAAVTPKPKPVVPAGAKKTVSDTHSQCSGSLKSFATPKPVKTPVVIKTPCSTKKPTCTKPKYNPKSQEEIIKAQEVEIKNKDHTINEYYKQIEELKQEICCLQSQIKRTEQNVSHLNELEKNIAQISITECKTQNHENSISNGENLRLKITELEELCEKLEQEVSSKQCELSLLEEVIEIRDSLCKDLQDKLTSTEKSLEETRQRLEMVKGHHALALEANESIRREYKAELETLKSKLEDEKQIIISKCKTDQENVKVQYSELIESVKDQMLKEKIEIVQELQQQLITKDLEMKAKLEQIDEATHEKLRLCEIQFEERSAQMQDHCEQQQMKIQYLEKEISELRYNISLEEENNRMLKKEMTEMTKENEALVADRAEYIKELNNLKEESKQKLIEFENEKNKLIQEVEKISKEKNKFEMSLSVTRDIVQVLTMRLRESDNELENLEDQLTVLTNEKERILEELTSYKNKCNNTIMECNEYKEALVNILKSKAALAKEHNRIMEHNVSLIESLQNVEKEAYRELGSIKSELIEDVELLKKESKSQIQMLREEIEQKRVLCELATEHAGQAAAAVEQSRALLAHASGEISRLETENERYHQEMQDQQSLVVELSLLRQENEELTMTVAKQSSIIDRMKKEIECQQIKPKSPSLIRKAHKIGKENLQNVQAVSPLRERNQ